MDIKIIVTYVLVPVVTIVASYFTAKNKTTKELIKAAREDQQHLDNIVSMNTKIERLEEHVEKLNEHREETSLTLVEVKTNLANINEKQSETQAMVSKIYTLLLKDK